MEDIHETARDFYLAKIANGEQPLQIAGGPLDGISYFETTIEDRRYWLTDTGLFDPTEDD